MGRRSGGGELVDMAMALVEGRAEAKGASGQVRLARIKSFDSKHAQCWISLPLVQYQGYYCT